MKREIKFRYRLKDLKTERITIHFLTIQELEEKTSKYFQGFQILSRDLYTGLKDKNGKEIYEGDIIKSERVWIRRIDWLGAGLWAVDVGGTGKDVELTHNSTKNFEVIGNIYENPQLLK